MRYNVLVIGCSHLSGAYDKEDNIVGPQSYAWHLRRLYDNKHRFVTIPNPAQGILKYAAIVEYMNRNGLLKDFTHCILQLTQEPRTVFMDNAEDDFFHGLHWLVTKKGDFIDGSRIQTSPSHMIASQVPRYMFEKYQSNFVKNEKYGPFGVFSKDMDFRGELLSVTDEISSSLENSYSAMSLLPSLYFYINETLKANNIKVASFDWWGKSTLQQDMLDMVSNDEYVFPKYKTVMNLMIEKDIWKPEEQSNLGHLNVSQSKDVAHILKEYLDNAEFFN